MAAAPEREEDPSPRPALDLTVSFSPPSISLKITDRQLAGRALTGIGIGCGVAAVALAVFFHRNPELVTGAVTRALEAPGIQVGNIAPGSILVELHCSTRESFLSFMEYFESGKVKGRLTKEFTKIGYEEELEVTITNDTEVYKELERIRKTDAIQSLKKQEPYSRRIRKDDDVTPHLNMAEYWHETFEQIFQDFSPDKWSLGPTKDAMPQEWQRFKDRAKVKFLCEECGNSWTSMGGTIIFWFRKIGEKEKREVEKSKQGDNDGSKTATKSSETGNVYSLKFKLFGQQCMRCDNEDFINPRWYKEEVNKVLKNVHQKIGENRLRRIGVPKEKTSE